MKLLNMIKKPQDVKKLTKKEMEQLAKEIRKFIIQSISKTGGHLSSNLGVVELTIALHYCFQTPNDKIIWDVGHQSYIHKLLTGRKERFDTLRKYKGLSGFPKTNESEHDIFNTGHSSTSISAALGFAMSRDLMKEKNYVLSVIGDGSLTGGMAFEALNYATHLKSNFIVILNDNSMSISKNVGALSKYLDKIRTEPFYTELKLDVENALRKIPKIGDNIVKTVKKSKESIKHLFVPGMLFEELGFTYLGPVDGHNIQELIEVFNRAKRLNQPILIHIKTIKGKGYVPAEKNPSKFHGTQPFCIKTGNTNNNNKNNNQMTYSQVFGETLVNIAEEDSNVVAITAAMPQGTGLKEFAKRYPKRFFDVGIAEQHAVTFAAGLAASGCVPVVAIYSSFLQRAYDQIIHDVCISSIPVIFAIDRSGIVGSDGETHQGIFDISFLSHIPNLSIIAPKSKQDLINGLKFAIKLKQPIAIRYPRGIVYESPNELKQSYEFGKSEIVIREKEIALIAVGSMFKTAYNAYQLLKEKGYNVTLINARFIKPLDENMLLDIINDHRFIFTLEENVCLGGYGQQVINFLKNYINDKVIINNFALKDRFIEHGSVQKLLEVNGLDYHNIVNEIEQTVKENKY